MNRDSNIISHVWLILWKKMSNHLNFSISYHPQTDDQDEVTNTTLGTLLRVFLKKNTIGLYKLLGLAEFTFNRAPSKVMVRAGKRVRSG